MKKSNFIIRIPEPCHEDWNSMQPDVKGKFCNSCNKSVIDFSYKTDPEIQTILLNYKDQKVCGRFKKTQIDRPLNISINLKDLPKNVSVTKAFAIALFIVFGTFLFSCTDEKGKPINAIEIVKPPQEDERMMLGSILSYFPPDSIKTNTITKLNETVSYSETHVAGGISYMQIPYIEEDSVKKVPPVKPDSVIEITNIEPRTLGMMSVSYFIPNDSLIPLDSVSLSNTESKLNGNQSIFNIYPNPSEGEFTIQYNVLKRADVTITIFDMSGALIKKVVDVNGQYEGQYHISVNLNELPEGVYMVRLINNGKQTMERLVIVK